MAVSSVVAVVTIEQIQVATNPYVTDTEQVRISGVSSKSTAARLPYWNDKRIAEETVVGSSRSGKRTRVRFAVVTQVLEGGVVQSARRTLTQKRYKSSTVPQ